MIRRTTVADSLQLVPKSEASPIRPLPHIFRRKASRYDSGTGHRRLEAHALFIGPIDKTDRSSGLQIEVIERADDFEGPQYTQRAIEFATSHDRVNVRTQQHRWTILTAGSNSGNVADIINLRFETRVLEPITEKITGLAIVVRKCETSDTAARSRADFGKRRQTLVQPLCVDVKWVIQDDSVDTT